MGRRDETKEDERRVVEHLQRYTDHESVWKPTRKRHDWSNLAVCRSFFDSVAKNLNFDPLSAQDWYKVSAKYIQKMVSFTFAKRLHDEPL